MTPAEALRAMARYIRKHGFSPHYRLPNSPGGTCGCFIHAADEISWNIDTKVVVLDTLSEVLGPSRWDEFATDRLQKQGWTNENIKDAAAACLIAADLVS